ncbi:CaiB/BaiF CoA transferase family protein [Acuticoccus sp.]|uniref:CaiB/BaiF CoA transferase family protein n=1 Tax=Acuticoccus sp. TaxID=1904378 RepID=UPI003B52CD86
MRAAGERGGPLAGLVVLDLTRVFAGPWATQVLADFGATVIKVEEPRQGDDTRAWGPPFQDNPADPERPLTPYFLACNRNKKSIAVDIASAEGADVVRRLAARADVMIENFKVGGLKRYGLDHASLTALNPRLVTCSITGFGQTGPYAPRGGYDFLIQGMGGFMSVTGQPDGEPTKLGLPITDIVTGLYATIAIQTALRHRDATGEGQHIDCALLDATIACLSNQSHSYLMGGPVPHRMGNAHPTVTPYRVFAVADGHVIVASAVDRQYQALCRMLGRTDLATDPRYATSPARLTNRAELEADLETEFARLTKDEAIARMVEHGVPGGPINTVADVFDDPQVRERRMVGTITDAAGTTVPTVRFPPVMERSPPEPPAPPPQLGEHTREVLAELGLDDAAVERMAEAGTIRLGR